MDSSIDMSNIHRYTLLCVSNLGVTSYHYSRFSKKVYASYLSKSINDVSFESNEFVIAVPIDLVECMNLLKSNEQAQLELLISLANTYIGLKPHDLSMLAT